MDHEPERAGEPSTSVPIYTIGYGSRSLEEFIAVLQEHGIAFLIDVRSAPYSSYKPEFSRQELERQVQARGIRYVYMGDQLGGQPASPDCYVDDKVVYDRVREKAFYQEGLERIRKAYERQLRVALMCSEGKPEVCHRSKLIGQSLADLGIAVQHIDENGRLRSQDEIVHELTDGQLNLFGDAPSFTSRKRYPPKDAGDA